MRKTQKVRASDLRPGDSLLTPRGQIARVTGPPIRMAGSGRPGMVTVRVATGPMTDPGWPEHFRSDDEVEVIR